MPTRQETFQIGWMLRMGSKPKELTPFFVISMNGGEDYELQLTRMKANAIMKRPEGLISIS